MTKLSDMLKKLSVILIDEEKHQIEIRFSIFASRLLHD